MTYPEQAELTGPPPEASAIIQNFDRLTAEMVTADGDRMIAEAEAYLRQACGDTEPSTDPAAAVVEQQPDALAALGRAENALGLEGETVAGILPYLMRDVGPTKEVRAAGKEQQARLQAASNNIFSDAQNEPAYQALLVMDPTALNVQDQERREYYIGRFEAARRASQAGTAEGAHTSREHLDTAAAEFRANIGKVTSVVLTPEELSSLPTDTRGQLGNAEAGGDLTVSLSEPNLNYILQNAPRELRKRAWENYYGDRVAANDQLLMTMATARHEVAEAEGKHSWTEKQTEGLTLGNPAVVDEFYNKIKPGIVERYQRSIERLQAMLEADGVPEPIAEYDLQYYEKKVMEESYDMDEITFTLERTYRGLLNMAENLYGIKIEKSPDTPTWAPGVKAYVVRDAGTDTEEGKVLGTFYADLMARKDADGEGGKIDGATTYGLRYARTETNASGEEETVQLPMAAMIANVAPPVNGQESKLTLRDVEVMAHELGHVMHIVLARTRGPEFGGDKLKFDIREIVSQMFEYLPHDPTVLLQFADDGASSEAKRLFMEKLDGVQEVRSSLEDIRVLRTMAADLGLHNAEPDLQVALQQAATLMAPVTTDNHWIRAQRHEAGDGYSGRYGSIYLFCAEQARKIVGWLRQNNYNPAIGGQLRHILELGGRAGAGEQLLAFANQSTAAAAGSAAIGTTS